MTQLSAISSAHPPSDTLSQSRKAASLQTLGGIDIAWLAQAIHPGLPLGIIWPALASELQLLEP